MTAPMDRCAQLLTVRVYLEPVECKYDAPMTPLATRCAGLAFVAFVAACSPAPQAHSTDWTLQIDSLTSAAPDGSAQPQLSVSSRGVLLSWIDRGEREREVLRFAERTPTGWSEARTVASGDDWFVNWADVPSVTRLEDGTLAAHWLQMSGEGTYAYDVRLSYSKDDGRTWSPSFTPHHDGTQTEHGFASLFQVPGAGLGLIWLDGRAMKPESHDDHDAPTKAQTTQMAQTTEAGGAMSVRFATFDATWKQTAEMPVDLRVCECCPTTAVVTSDGPLVAFRNRSDEEIRDIYVSRLENGAWTEPKAVHDDGWKIPACPVNGPMLSARGRDVVIAWFTVKEDGGRAFVAFSNDAGRTFGAPIRLDDAATLGRVDIQLLPDGSAVATWIEFAGGTSQLRARRVQPSGATSPALIVSSINKERSSGYPRVAAHGNEIVFAWTESENGQTRVRTAVARLPMTLTD